MKAYGTAYGQVDHVEQDDAGWTVSIAGEVFDCAPWVAADAEKLLHQEVIARVTYDHEGETRTPLRLLKLRASEEAKGSSAFSHNRGQAKTAVYPR